MLNSAYCLLLNDAKRCKLLLLRDNEITNCGLDNGGYIGGVCSPDYWNCYAECYDVSCCYDYTCGGGSYYGYLNW